MTQRSDGLQLVRAFAALLVVGFHFTPHLPPDFQKISHWGFMGVDIFFVLSGFVVALNSESATGFGGASRFLIKRSLRIYLGYWPVLALWIVVAELLFNQSPNIAHLWSSLLLTDTSMARQWLPVAWSLAFEMLFYCMAAVFIATIRPNWRLTGYACLFLILVTWNMYWLVARRDEVLAGVQPWRGILSAYGVEFLAGAMLAGVRKNFRWHPQWLPFLLGLAGLGFSVGSFSDWFDKVELLRAGSFGLIGVSVVLLGWLSPVGDAGRSRDRPAPLLRVGVSIGNASFALYLLHPIVLEVGVWAASRWSPTSTGEPAFLSAMFVACVLFAWVWYRILERPMYDFAVNQLLTRPFSIDHRAAGS